VFTGDDPAAVFAELHTALGAHRVWERFDTALS
jgi:catalase